MQSEQALLLLAEMRTHGLEPDVITFSAAISACERGANWEQALALLAEMRERGLACDITVFSAAVNACEQGAQWELALELISEMRASGMQPHVPTLKAAISACEKGQQWDKALGLLSELRELGHGAPSESAGSGNSAAAKQQSQWAENAVAALLEDEETKPYAARVAEFEALSEVERPVSLDSTFDSSGSSSQSEAPLADDDAEGLQQ